MSPVTAGLPAESLREIPRRQPDPASRARDGVPDLDAWRSGVKRTDTDSVTGLGYGNANSMRSAHQSMGLRDENFNPTAKYRAMQQKRADSYYRWLASLEEDDIVFTDSGLKKQVIPGLLIDPNWEGAEEFTSKVRERAEKFFYGVDPNDRSTLARLHWIACADMGYCDTPFYTLTAEVIAENLLELGGGGRGRGRGGCNSFIPGTEVLLADGTTKEIEDLETGDKVVATDPETGETSVETVTAEIIGKGAKHLVKITIDITPGDGDDTAAETLTATDGHPFWVEGPDEWIKATDLKRGDWLRTGAGTLVQVTAVERWTQQATVHNLTITDLHTYYVLAGDTSVLVHNTSRGPGCEFPDAVKRQGVDRNLVANNGKLRCEYCNQSIQFAEKSKRGVKPPDNELAYDHFNPVNRGGKGTLENLVISCRTCNTRKGDQDPLSWLMKGLGMV